MFDLDATNAKMKEEKEKSDRTIKRLVIIAVSTVSNYIELKENTYDNKSLDMIERSYF